MRVRAFLVSVMLQLTLAAPVLAETPLPAVWYRASEVCPAGAEFLQKLAENARHARLAQAGDHIDFVVTLVTNGKETVGRLERQTNSGIVAIRELRDETCERVADALIGISTQPQPRAQGFADFRPSTLRQLPDLSLRGGVVGSWGASDTPIGSVRRWVLAGRVEGCPVAWTRARFDLRPCVGFELGATGASSQGESGIDDRAIWAAPGGQLRFSVALAPRLVWVELSGGALVPLTRNEIFSRSRSLYRDGLGVFHASLGISLRLP